MAARIADRYGMLCYDWLLLLRIVGSIEMVKLLSTISFVQRIGMFRFVSRKQKLSDLF